MTASDRQLLHELRSDGPFNQPRGGAVEAKLPMRKLREGKHWIVDHRTGCWEWTGHTLHGYGQHRYGPAHRIVWRQFGHEIPEGNDLHHRCQNPLCVNPAHMEPVDKAEHVAAHHRFNSGLDWDKVREIRSLGPVGLDAIVEQFGICRTDAFYVLSNQRWHDPDYVPGWVVTCAQCGEPFRTLKANKKFCSKEHSRQWHSRRTTRRKSGLPLDDRRDFRRRAA